VLVRRRDQSSDIQALMHAQHLVAFDPASGARLRRAREVNQDGLYRTYQLIPGVGHATAGRLVTIRGVEDDTAIAEANRVPASGWLWTKL
jgi:hypothetical protein